MVPEISIIISTYNATEWLQKVLFGYNNQTYTNFEVVVADDGSTEETAQLIKDLQKKVNYNISHIWHPDNGFQKTIILNKAIIACKAEYIIMSDGDCIPRNDFVQTHFTRRRKNCFLSGGYFKLPLDISQEITLKNIQNQDCFNIEWLLERGLKKSFKNTKITAKKNKSNLLNKITPTNASWNGHNSSAWKKDILHVNGFDERMQYGGEDRELGERLMNYGIKPIQIRYSAICVHLDHKRGYVKPEMIAKNKAIRKSTKERKVIKTSYGIDKSDLITLDKSLYIGEGLERICYEHPSNPNLCIKVVQPTAKIKHVYNEIKYYQKIRNKNKAKFEYPFYASYHGEVETNFGIGFIYDLIKDETTQQTSLTLRHYIENSTTISDQEIISGLKKLKSEMIKHKVFAGDLRARNICCKILKNKKIEFIIVDGIGHRDFFPIADWLSYFAKKKVERRFFKAKLHSLNEQRSLIKSLRDIGETP